MKVLDVFCGLKGWSEPFIRAGHDVVTIDFDDKFQPDVCQDVMNIGMLEKVDLILASPPCECFSVASLPYYWKNGLPAHPKTIKAIELVQHTLNLIESSGTKFWILENPVGMLRTQKFMMPYPRTTVTYCQYGESYRKPTDLWGYVPSSFHFRRPCKNGDKCHTPSPRSEKNVGLQSLGNAADKALIPFQLANDIMVAMEEEIKFPGPRVRQSRLRGF